MEIVNEFIRETESVGINDGVGQSLQNWINDNTALNDEKEKTADLKEALKILCNNKTIKETYPSVIPRCEIGLSVGQKEKNSKFRDAANSVIAENRVNKKNREEPQAKQQTNKEKLRDEVNSVYNKLVRNPNADLRSDLKDKVSEYISELEKTSTTKDQSDIDMLYKLSKKEGFFNQDTDAENLFNKVNSISSGRTSGGKKTKKRKKNKQKKNKQKKKSKKKYQKKN